jgi:phosphatidylglycerophosphate synthase
MAARREYLGVLWWPEQYCIRALVGRFPRFVVPDHLTALALVGALVAGLALLGCRFSAWALLPFYLGLFANWVGDSFDGALARHRRIERHRVGFLIDRASDVLSFAIIILALGLSPYLTRDTALMLLVAYLVHAIYALMRTVVDGVQIIGVGGVGATEGRIFVGVWVGVIQVAQLNLTSFQIGRIGVFDVLGAALLVAWLGVFVRRVALDVSRISGIEQAVFSLRHGVHGDGDSLVVHQGDKGRLPPEHDAALHGVRFSPK